MRPQFRAPLVDVNDTEIKKNAEQIIEPKTIKDKKRLEFLQKKAEADEILPPNINKTGDKNVTIKDGKIIFGQNVTSENAENCPENITRARLKQKLAYNKIFN